MPTTGRGLSPEFMNDLRSGILSPLMKRVIDDRTLCLEIREDYANIYYRGGNLIKLARDKAGYSAAFDQGYFKKAAKAHSASPPPVIRVAANVAEWLTALPHLKQAMDLFSKDRAEREVQQLVARDNNRGALGRSTDYYVCDIEYASKHGRFDVVGVHWPSRATDRKQSAGRRLVVAEVKFGDKALTGHAGLHKHIRDVEKCLSDSANLSALKNEMVRVFNQKRQLKLIECDRDLSGLSDEKPLLILVLANHDPDKTVLRKELENLPVCECVDLRIASASMLGYALFEPAMLTSEAMLDRMDAWI